MTRKKAALIVSLGVFFLGIFSSLSFGVMKGFTIGGLAFFDALDYLTAKIMLPLGGMLTCIFVGTRVDKKVLKAELTNEGTEIRGPNRHRYRIFERIRDLEMDYR